MKILDLAMKLQSGNKFYHLLLFKNCVKGKCDSYKKSTHLHKFNYKVTKGKDMREK